MKSLVLFSALIAVAVASHNHNQNFQPVGPGGAVPSRGHAVTLPGKVPGRQGNNFGGQQQFGTYGNQQAFGTNGAGHNRGQHTKPLYPQQQPHGTNTGAGYNRGQHTKPLYPPQQTHGSINQHRPAGGLNRPAVQPSNNYGGGRNQFGQQAAFVPQKNNGRGY